jgi:sialic acid synthase SpsE
MFIIAEIGTGHLGRQDKALELIRAAAEAGADCAKFQVVFADEIIHPLTGELNLPGGRVRLYDRFVEVEQEAEFYAFCKRETEAAGMVFLASPFGLRSAQILQDLGSSWFKVASPELNHFPLLERLRRFNKPVVLSSGVSRLEDIERAVELFDGVAVSLLHCITAYPAPPEEYNLRVLRPLSVLFGCPVGVSDHSMDPELVPVIGRAAGATLVEKHFCLSRLDPGLDDPIALDPPLFRRMTDALRSLEAAPAAEWDRLIRDRYGTDRVEAILGTGRKVLAPSERANYERTNRSLHAVRSLPAGHRLAEGDLAVLRTEKVLRPGLSPGFLTTLLGKTLRRDLPAGEGIEWDDLLS